MMYRVYLMYPYYVAYDTVLLDMNMMRLRGLSRIANDNMGSYAEVWNSKVNTP